MFLTARGSLSIAFDALVLLLPHGTNTTVGLIEGTAGVAGTIATISAGCIGDRVKRVVLLRTSAFCALANAVLTIVIVYYVVPHYDSHVTFVALIVAQTFVNSTRAIGGVGNDSLFADSTPRNSRNYWYARKQAATTIGLGTGPLIGVVIFSVLSNTWTRFELFAVMTSAAVISLLVAVNALCLRDIDKRPVALLAQQDALLDASSPAAEAAEPSPPLEPAAAAATARMVPPLVTACSILQGLGSGATYKFVPLFCWKELGLMPVQTYAIVAGSQLMATALSFVNARVGRTVGPMGAVLAMMGIGIGCLALVIACRDTNVVVVALLVRGASMNSIAGILGATLNDYCDERRRAKWNMMMQFAMATWSGSAFLGGYVSDRYGYRATFLVTLTFHSLSALCLVPLAFVVPPEHLRGKAKGRVTSMVTSARPAVTGRGNSTR